MGTRKKSVKEFFRQFTFKDWVKAIFAVLGLIIGTSVAISFYKINNYFAIDSQNNIDNSENTGVQITDSEDISIESIVNGDSYTEEVTNAYYAALIDENTSERTLLQYAENAFLAGSYEECIKIYSMDKLQDNAIANNNVGYFYANGIYFPENIETADRYYDKAQAEGSKKAFENKLALHLRNKMDDSIQLLQQGYDIKNEKTIDFIAFQIQGYDDFSNEEKWQYAYQYCYGITEEGQKDIWERLYYWDEEETIYLTGRAEAGTELVQYILVDENSSVGATVKTYKKYVRKCSGIDILEERIERTDE